MEIFEIFLDEDGQDEDRDGDEDVRGRQFSEISGTSEDEDGEDVDVLRRPDPNHSFNCNMMTPFIIIHDDH